MWQWCSYFHLKIFRAKWLFHSWINGRVSTIEKHFAAFASAEIKGWQKWEREKWEKQFSDGIILAYIRFDASRFSDELDVEITGLFICNFCKINIWWIVESEITQFGKIKIVRVNKIIERFKLTKSEVIESTCLHEKNKLNPLLSHATSNWKSLFYKNIPRKLFKSLMWNKSSGNSEKNLTGKCWKLCLPFSFETFQTSQFNKL